MALMVSCYMPLRHSMDPTGVSWLSKWQAIKAFHICIELQQECDLFFLFFIVYMTWIDKCNQADEFATIGRLKNQLPAMCWWFDSASTESGFQYILDRFAATYDTAGTKISSVKTDLLHVSRNTIISACSNWMERHRNKYLGVAFTSDVRQKKTGYPNWQRNCNNESFTIFSCYETIQCL